MAPRLQPKCGPTAERGGTLRQLVLSLFTAPKKGMFALLNEECVFPKGSDSSFLDKLFGLQKDNKCMLKPPPSRKRDKDLAFAIQHYAGVVAYSAENFLLKNKDPLSEDVMVTPRPCPPPHTRAATPIPVT